MLGLGLKLGPLGFRERENLREIILVRYCKLSYPVSNFVGAGSGVSSAWKPPRNARIRPESRSALPN